MSDTRPVVVPDLGDFSDVDVIEVLVGQGDQISVDQPLLTLETDKATMDVPAPFAGVVEKTEVRVGDKLSAGDVVLQVRVSDQQQDRSAAASEPAPGTAASAQPQNEQRGVPQRGDADLRCEVAVLGAGPGGYTAAFRAADLGLDVVLIERWPTLGGVCLNVGCIPSKALLHAAKVIEDAKAMAAHGIRFGEPSIDKDALRGWKNDVVAKLTGGLDGLARKRKIRVLTGEAEFVDDHHLAVNGTAGTQLLRFDQCIIGAGSEPLMLPGLPDDPRVMDSTAALELEELPDSLLVIGGGIIGLEMATVYDALGVRVTVVELTRQLMPGCDPDLVRPLAKRIGERYERILLGVKVTAIEALEHGLRVSFEGDDAPEPQTFGRVLVAVGRRPNGHRIAAEKAGVSVDERGFITADKQQRTNVSHIFAIGDICGNPMLAHKATHEARVAAEVAAGLKRAFDARVIPSVAYTDPEVAWVGVTEHEAREQGIAYEKGVFPWAASGRSLAIGRDEGFTKILFDPKTDRVIGAGIVGSNAGDLIAEVGLAIEMGCDAADIGLTIHPHPTLSETVALAAEMFEGTITDLSAPKRK